MPLLVCPNDNAAMQSVSRSGVEFDFCPTCRGVWLDRGELEKLMEASRADVPPAPPLQGQPRGPAPDPRYRQPERYDGDHRRRDYDDDDHRYHGRRKRGFDLFDIFD